MAGQRVSNYIQRALAGHNRYGQPAIVVFRRSVLATMVSKRMQTTVILLQQYSPGHITTCISVNHKRLIKVRQA